MNQTLTNLAGALRGMWTLVWAQRCTKRALIWMAVAAAAMALLMLSNIGSGNERVWMGWVVVFYLHFLVPLTCLNVCGSMMRSEVQANTLSFLTTRPHHRHTLYLLQYVCHVGWLQLVFFICAMGLFALGAVKQVEGLGTLLPLFLITQFLAVLAWSALSALLGLLHQRFMVIGIIYWLIVEIALGQVEISNINQLSVLRQLHTLLGQNELVYKVFPWTNEAPIMALGVLLIATLFFLAAGAAMFTFREYLPSQEAGQQ